MFKPEKLFVYGTLQEANQMIALLGRLPSDPFRATLKGYRRFDTGRGYPVALPEEGAEITGVLWAGLPGFMIERLDDYEGGLGVMYDRVQVSVILDTGDEEMAWFYVGVPSYWRERALPKMK
jgi:gamma-glutamylcyclotransferase (GGCT)/AIG2-like uncharacterized protein YtfP